jgi:glyoxylase-like metal-dependent hydrolase (beta-lactamase superfamily II)
MAEVTRIALGKARLTRVPYFDLSIDPSQLGLTPEQLAALPWAVPSWVDEQGKVRFGQAVWVIESADERIVVDPCGAVDRFLRSGPEARTHQDAVFAALRRAGVEPDDVDVVVLSHLDGIGMAAAVAEDGSWAPAFANARVVISAAECTFIDDSAEPRDGAEAFAALRRHGVVDAVEVPHRITDEVELVLTGGHTPGHCALWVRSGGEHALFVGHLAINPVHTAGPCEELNHDPVAAWHVLRALLDEALAHDAVVIGPLWPTPGAARVVEEGTRKLIVYDVAPG